MSKTNHPMEQGRRKRAMTKTMKKVIRERIENPVRRRKFPNKAEVKNPIPGEPAKGPQHIGRVNSATTGR